MARLTPQQIEQIEEWAEKGKSAQWIARHLDLKPSSVNYRILRAGYDPWPGRARSKNNQVGAFSPEEDARMLELARTMSSYRVAIEMKRPKTSILIRLMTLEVRAEKKLETACAPQS